MKKSKDERETHEAKFEKWYEEFPKAHDIAAPCKTELEVMELKDSAKKCLDSDTAAYNLKQSKIRKSDFSWMKTLLSKGTVGDKLAASIILIQDNPKYNLSRLTNLISMVKVSKKKQCTMIIDNLRELFCTDLLHPEYKLNKFEEQDFSFLNNKPFADNPMKKRQLIAHWYFEDQLKIAYSQFIDALTAVAHDTLDANKEKSINNMYKLLTSNAEQENKLLTQIVNKIGDPSSRVASKAVFCLSQLLNEHPNMKQVVLNDVEKLLFRQNVTQKAQYYGVCLLAQFVLDSESKEVANNLIAVYFSFFKACLKKGEVDSRMMGALLMGVNRAFPFSEMETEKLAEHVDTIYKVIHIASFNVGLNALSLLHQIVGKDVKQGDRFYCAFYKKLLDPQIASSNRQAIFLSLLFKVLKKDNSKTRVKAFVKRILQISVYLPANLICALLYMLSQVFKTRKQIYAEMFRGNVNRAGFENKEIKIDDSVEEVEENEGESSIMLSNMKVTSPTNLGETVESKVEVKDESIKKYDPYHRNPIYAGANFSFCTELRVLAHHFHPTVALFANTIIKGKSIIYTGDPLQDFTTIRFLDRYVFKNPKKLEERKQQLNKNNPLAKRTTYTAKGVKSIPVDSTMYINEDEDKIPVDELFLYRYLKTRTTLPKDRKDGEEDDDDLESVNSEEFNTMLDGLSKDKDFDDIDIAGEISASKKKRKNDEDDDDEDESEESDDDEKNSEDESMEEEDVGSDDEMLDEMVEMEEDDLDGIDDEDLSDMDFSDDEDDDEEELVSKTKASKSSKKKKSNFDENIFAAAEEFAELLDEEGSAKTKHGGANAMSNADKAAAKQLDWEEKRNRWIKGYNKSVGKPRSRGASQKKGVKRFKKR